MSRSELPESTASELQALYREAAQAEPDAMLDRRILDAARAELRGAGEATARRRPPWWKGWLPVASALALALVGVSVTWRVMDQQERDLRQEMKAAEGVREIPAAGSAAPARDAAKAPSLSGTPAPAAEQSSRVESATVKDGRADVSGAAAMPVPAAPAAMAPAPAAEAEKKTPRADMDELQESRTAPVAADPVSARARQMPKQEAGGPGIDARGDSAAESFVGPAGKATAGSAVAPAAVLADDAATPEAWLKQIRELRAAGRDAEAAQSLARFRARHPGFALPADLRNLE